MRWLEFDRLRILDEIDSASREALELMPDDMKRRMCEALVDVLTGAALAAARSGFELYTILFFVGHVAGEHVFDYCCKRVDGVTRDLGNGVRAAVVCNGVEIVARVYGSACGVARARPDRFLDIIAKPCMQAA